ncbi:hypothetical protein MRO55_25355, partial [Escherichia coli]|uniref:hypothetical protein n=1 Tax=Escherichia coli TaxID=562 RepID=UPI002114D7B0
WPARRGTHRPDPEVASMPDEERPVAPGGTGASYNEPELAEELEEPTPAPAEEDERGDPGEDEV